MIAGIADDCLVKGSRSKMRDYALRVLKLVAPLHQSIRLCRHGEETKMQSRDADTAIE